MRMQMKGFLGGMIVFFYFSLGSALAYNITGTIQNNTGNSTSQVYVTLTDSGSSQSTCFGTTISNIPNGTSKSFTIRGVPSGSYQVAAFMDDDNTGSLHMNDPANSSDSFDLNSDYNISSSIPLNTPSTTPPSPVGSISVVTTSNGALLVWKGPKSPYGGNGPNAEVADSYTISWGNSANPGNGSPALGSMPVPANGGDYHVFVSGLSQNSSYYFAVNAVNGGGGAYSATSSSSLIAASAGAATVTGRVYSPGIAKNASTPLYIVLIPNNGMPFIADIPSPTDTQSWSIAGVQPGTYSVYAILDLNNDGFASSVGKALSRGMQFGASASVTVASGAASATAPDVTLYAPNSNTSVNTQNNSNSWYSLQVRVNSGIKMAISATVNSGPNITGPIDLGLSLDSGNGATFGSSGTVADFNTKPLVGDAYSVTVGYSDGSSEVLSPAVTGVVTASPSLVFPQGNTGTINGSTLFAWASPSNPPAGYYDYSLSMNDNSNNNQIWNPQNNSNSNMPSTQLSLLYNSDGSAQQSSITSGTYNWGINIQDGNGNQAWGSSVQFFPHNGGPSISNFSPTTGSSGTSVIITGSGFTGASGVTFGGANAPVFTVNSDNQITATVPAGAIVGPITVTTSGITNGSSTPFQATITYVSAVQDFSGTAINGATVSVENSSPLVSTTTNASGNFSITAPSGAPFALRISNNGYHDTLTAQYSMSSNSNSSTSPFKLYTDADLTGLSLSVASKGLIATSVKDWDTNASIPGATVTATSFLHPNSPYTVTYTGAGTSTASDGKFYVPNVDEGDIVGVTAAVNGDVTQPRTFVTHTGVIDASSVHVTPSPLVTATPSGGSILSTQGVALSVTNPVNGDSYAIKYTTDGSDPTASFSAQTYSAPINLPVGTITLRFSAVNTTHNIGGAAFTASYTVSLPPAPGSPTGVTATAGNGQAVVSFTPPASNGGNPYEYSVTSSPGNIVASGSGSPITVFGLTNGTPYTFTVTAQNNYGTSAPSAPSNSVTPNPPALAVTINGTGSGSINSIPSGIACVSGSPTGCSSFFTGSPFVSLNATPDWKSLFNSWSGDCAGIGPCAFTMNANHSVTATFNANLQAELFPAATAFASLQDACNAAMNGNTIKAHVYTFQENLLTNTPSSFTLNGGMDSGYLSTIGMTTLHGTLTVGMGALTLNNLIIQ